MSIFIGLLDPPIAGQVLTCSVDGTPQTLYCVVDGFGSNGWEHV